MFLVYIWCGCFYIIYILLFIYLPVYLWLFIIFGIKRAWVKTIRSENPHQHSPLKTGKKFRRPNPTTSQPFKEILNISDLFFLTLFSGLCIT